MAVGENDKHVGLGSAGARWLANPSALRVVEDRLGLVESGRSAGHAALLTDTLELERLSRESGGGIGVVAHLALLLECSEFRADGLLLQALVLRDLPEGIAELARGLLTVEQAAAFVSETSQLPRQVRERVWQRLLTVLRDAETGGAGLAPARLREKLRAWIIQADPALAVQRRKAAAVGSVEWRKRDDGLVDLFALGISGPNAKACLSSIAARSFPIGPNDLRSADQRRLDAVVDLLTGRCSAGAPGCGPGCGCGSGSVVPCGSPLQVLVPIGAALGTTDECATLVGHGPIEPDLLQELLLSAPVLRTVWVDQNGVPVGISDRSRKVRRRDPADLRNALLTLVEEPVPAGSHQPRHPHDHVDVQLESRGGVTAGQAADSRDEHATDSGTGRAHRPDLPGRYVVPRWLRRLLTVRRPLCEWPGCGTAATRCDMEHDRAWPDGPTCACNLGPCCRRHHRIKQTGWTKTRTAMGVRWSGPTGRSWFSPTPHEPAAPAVRPILPIRVPHPLELLGDLELEAELRSGFPDSALFDDQPSSRCDDADQLAEPETRDSLGDRLRTHGTTWTVDLDDPYAWDDIPTCEPSLGRACP